MARGQGKGLHHDTGLPYNNYEHGTLQSALRQLYARTGKKKYFDYIVEGSSNIITPDGGLIGAYNLTEFNIDSLRVGPTMLYLHTVTGDKKWKAAADNLKYQLAVHPRTAQGQFWHKLRYPNQGWLDGIYMGDVFYAQYVHLYQPKNETAWNDLVLQYKLMVENTLERPGAANYTGLLYHGYDHSKTQIWANPDRGHAPEIWDRALGWFFMALVDTLEFLPRNNKLYAEQLNILRLLAPRLVKAADPKTGAWWLVMSQPGRERNYLESSGTAMFIYSLLKGVRLGFIQDKDGSIVAAAKKAYKYTVATWVKEAADGTFDWYGTVQVGSLSGNGTFDYYVGVPIAINDLKGLGPFIMASIEIERLK